MLTPPQSDLAGVVRGLTRSQRAGIASGFYNDDSSLRGRQRAMFYDLTNRGFFGAPERIGPRDYVLTPLGEQVRAFLSAQSRTTGE